MIMKFSYSENPGNLLSPDKILLILGSYGIDGQANAKGWVNFPSPFREDRNPSAGLNLYSGVFHDFGGEKLRFWDFVARLGNFHDWRAARDHFMGDRWQNASSRPVSRASNRTKVAKTRNAKSAKFSRG